MPIAGRIDWKYPRPKQNVRNGRRKLNTGLAKLQTSANVLGLAVGEEGTDVERVVERGFHANDDVERLGLSSTPKEKKKKNRGKTDGNGSQDGVVVGLVARNEALQDFRVDFRDVGELDLVDLGAFSARGGRGIGEGDVELLGPSVEAELMNTENVLATIVHTTRGEAGRVCELMRDKQEIGLVHLRRNVELKATNKVHSHPRWKSLLRGRDDDWETQT